MKKSILYVSAIAVSMAFYGCNSGEEPVEDNNTEETAEDTAEEGTEERQEAQDLTITSGDEKTSAAAEKTPEEQQAEEIKQAEEDILSSGRGKGIGNVKELEIDEEAAGKAAEIKEAEEDAIKNRVPKSDENRGGVRRY